MVQLQRRSVLTSIGLAVTGGSILTRRGTAQREPPSPKVLKGTVTNPVRESQITRVRETVREELAAMPNSVSEMAVAGTPVPDDRELVGYGIGVNNGAPVETIKTVYDPERSPKQQPDAINAHSSVGSPRSTPAHNRKPRTTASIPDHATAKGVEQRMNAAHRDLERFRRSIGEEA